MRCKPMETIYETYIRTLCSNCKNREQNLCEIRRNINNSLQCCYYIKDRHIVGYRKTEKITAKQQKPIMRM